MARAIDKYVCPFCGQKTLFVGVHDDEGNYHGLVGCEYENDPWSGLSYALHHEGWGDCPLCTDGAYNTMGGMLFDTAEEAINALTPPTEPLTLDELLKMDGEPVWVEEVEHWALIDIEKSGQWAGIPFAVWAENGANFTYNIEGRELHCFRRPPEGAGNA